MIYYLCTILIHDFTVHQDRHKRRVNLRLGIETYSYFEESVKQGRYRSVAALIAHLCDCVMVKGRVREDNGPVDVEEEVNSMFSYYSEGRGK